MYKAIKKFDHKKFCLEQSHKIVNNEQFELYLKEYRILKVLVRPNILTVYKAFLFGNIFLMILDHADNGDLSRLI
jgi:hypothetical protein